MSKRDKNLLQAIFKEQLPGMQITKTEILHKSRLYIHIGEEITIQHVNDEVETRSPWVFWLDVCEWRVLSNEHFVVGVRNDDEIYPYLECLADRKVIKITMDSATHDLEIRLEGGYSIQTFSVYQHAAQWQLQCENGGSFEIGTNGEIYYED